MVKQTDAHVNPDAPTVITHLVANARSLEASSVAYGYLLQAIESLHNNVVDMPIPVMVWTVDGHEITTDLGAEERPLQREVMLTMAAHHAQSMERHANDVHRLATQLMKMIEDGKPKPAPKPKAVPAAPAEEHDADEE